MAKERVGEETCRASIRGDRPVSSVECCSMFAYKAVFIDKFRVSRGKYGGLLFSDGKSTNIGSQSQASVMDETDSSLLHFYSRRLTADHSLATTI